MTQDAATPALDDLLCFAIHSTGFAFNRVYRKPLAKLGLTYPQFLAMAALWDEDAMTVGALGAKLSLDTSTLTPLLKRLEAMRLLSRRRSPEDERRVVVSLTPQGSALGAEAGEVFACIQAAADLSPAAFAKLTRDIQTLRRNLERAEEL